MRRLVVILIVLCTGSVAYAQVTGGVLPVPGAVLPLPVPLPPVPFYGSSSSVIDHNGNLLVFDIQYSYPTPVMGQPTIPPTIQTRVTVIAPDGTVKPSASYPGALQVIGAGWYAVYAVINTYSTGPTTMLPTRRLVAFNVVAGVPLSPLPAVDAPIRAEIKLYAAKDNTGFDLITFVDPPSDPRILAPTASPVARLAHIIKYVGGANFVVGTPIPLS